MNKWIWSNEFVLYYSRGVKENSFTKKDTYEATY